MNTLDTRGYSCPEPVLMTKAALAKGKPLTVLVDGDAPLENVTRMAQNGGHTVTRRQVGDDWELVIS